MCSTSALPEAAGVGQRDTGGTAGHGDCAGNREDTLGTKSTRHGEPKKGTKK